MRFYLLPGLGADPRIYANVDLGQQHELIALDWIPCGTARNLAEYAAMLHAHYTLEPPYVLGGVSLGGMLAQEWARVAPPEALVLISTATSRDDMAAVIRMASSLNIGPLLSKQFLIALGVIGDRFTSKTLKGRELFLDMLQKSDGDFLQFGAQAVLNWEPVPLDTPTLRIHGSVDKVFPCGKWEGCHVLKNGNHFMIFDRGEEIAEVIKARFKEGVELAEKTRVG